MKFFFVVGLALALSASGFAQHRMGGRMGRGVVRSRGPVIAVEPVVPFRTYGSPSGFGNVVFPGTGTPPPFTTSFPTSETFVERFGDVIQGVPYTGVRGHGFRGRGFYGGGFYGPLAWPVAVPTYGENYEEQAPPPVVVQPQQGAPPVTINQYFTSPGAAPNVQEYPQSGEAAPPEANSNVQVYRAPSRPAASSASDNQVLFFIALKDSSVYTAVAYWVEDGTLHYITPQGQHNQVSLALVDRSISARLNAGRGVDFQLPPAG